MSKFIEKLEVNGKYNRVLSNDRTAKLKINEVIEYVNKVLKILKIEKEDK